MAGMTVSLGGSACTGVNINGAGTSATCTTTAHTGGTVDSMLTANGHSDTFPGLYMYATANALPGSKPSVVPAGNPGAEPSSRPAGQTSNTPPNPLPPARP